MPQAGGTFTGKITHNYTSSLTIPSGTTAQRDGSPAVGMFRHNSTLNQFEGYNNGLGVLLEEVLELREEVQMKCSLSQIKLQQLLTVLRQIKTHILLVLQLTQESQ